MVINRQQGMASNYDCCICACPLSYSPSYDYVSPASTKLLVGRSAGLVYNAGYVDCNYDTYMYNETSAASWSSAHPNIATVNSSGRVTGQSGGTTSIGGQYSDYIYYSNPYLPPYCFVALLAVGSGSGGANVLPHITSISPSRGLIGATTSVTISGSGFGTSATVNAGSGITVANSSVSDTQISVNFQVASNAPSGNHTVTVSTAVGTSNSVNFYVQVPSLVQVISNSTTAVTCTLNGNTTNACLRLLRYQVKDQESTPQPIPVVAMIIDEYIHLQTNGCQTGAPTAGSWQTDNTGSMPANNPDGIGTCSGLCNGGTACTEAWYQKFTVYQAGTYAVSILSQDGTTKGACNYWSNSMTPTACSNCATQTIGSCPSPF
jgi:hypothetical protein